MLGWTKWGNRAALTVPVSPPVSIPAVFAAQVARTPEAVAVSSGDRFDDAIESLTKRLIGWRTC